MFTTSSAIRMRAVSTSAGVSLAEKMLCTLATSTPPTSRLAAPMNRKITRNMPLIFATPFSPSPAS